MQLLTLVLSIALLQASDTMSEPGASTIIGPTNPDLSAGADALRSGDAELGIRLTQRGLAVAGSAHERQVGLSNLCAGYVMVENYTTALDYCDAALAENDRNWRALSNRAFAYLKVGRYDDAQVDIDRALSIAPNARVVKIVRGMLLDETNPVAPSITIDDRRDAGEHRDD